MFLNFIQKKLKSLGVPFLVLENCNLNSLTLVALHTLSKEVKWQSS